MVDLVEFNLFVMKSTINSINSSNITKVLYMSFSFGLLGVESRYFSHAEKILNDSYRVSRIKVYKVNQL